MFTYGLLFILALGIAAFGVNVLVQSWRITQATDRAWYSIEQQKMKSSARSLGFLAGLFFCASGGLLIYLLLNPPEKTATELIQPLPSPTVQAVSETPSVTNLPIVTDLLPTSEPMRTPRPAMNATISDTNDIPLVAIPTVDLGIQAIVTNTGGGGLWLRNAPFGDGLVLIPEESVVFIRGGLVEVDGLNWQKVAESSGREGWVAADYLIYR
ncbi:MAG: SH3 domain-containing protein [Anaerolineales bacterium]|nr:SH3 domain-containing protein [Anaerolineales bacterium]